MTIRIIVLTIATGDLVFAVAIAVLFHSPILAGYFALVGMVLLVSVVFERWRYQKQTDSRGADWTDTDERFVDPGSGRVLKVRYNSRTGERDYVDAEQPARKGR